MPEITETLPSVAIAGWGAISAVGIGIDNLREALRANISGLRACERFNDSRFQSNVVGAIPRECDFQHDPAYGLATEAVLQASKQARAILAEIPPERMGLVLATTKANIEALERLMGGDLCSADAHRHLQADLLA